MSFYDGDTLHAGAIVPAEATANLQWQFAPHSIGPWSDIGGETGSTYVVQESDAGGYIRVKATGSGFWRGTVYSNDTGEILSGYGFTIEITLAGADTFTLPLVQKYNTDQYCAYNCVVDWGDGSENSVITAYNDADRTHSYAGAGTYQIKITGTMDGWSFNNAGDKLLVTKVVRWGTPGVFGGFKYLKCGFYGCANLTSLGVGKILASTTGANDGVELDGFYNTFRGCTALTAIPSGLFDNHTSVSTSAFRYTFFGCTTITSIPPGLFDYNTAVSSSGFYGTFCDCTNLVTIPSGLFRYNTDCTSFETGFYNCPKVLQVKDLWYASGEEGTRFLNKSVSFGRCFYRSSYTGTGTAPELWKYTSGLSIQQTMECWGGAGNNTTSLTNYANIPFLWRG